VNNNTGAALPASVVSDELPAGFSYVHGSARLNGAHLADPAGGAGPGLEFALGALPKAAQLTLSYRVRIGAGAQGGSGTNLAQAVSGHLASNHASVTVQITGGVFASDAYLIGKVFADCNANGIQDPGEPGIPGVRKAISILRREIDLTMGQIGCPSLDQLDPSFVYNGAR